ncbi:MAG TPA: CopD family protein [Stellaceae bacterium]|nr:CopD family protein [Stellaceae bacterium]
MEILLVGSRAVHFAAVIALTGAAAFEALIAVPSLRQAGLEGGAEARRVRRRLVALAGIGLGLGFVSGVGWLAAVTARMSGEPLLPALIGGNAATVLTQTQFGRSCLVRLGLALVAAGLFATPRAGPPRWLALAAALAMSGGLAWTGHGAATPGASGNLHLAGDILHLAGAGLWLGMLVPLHLFLGAARAAAERPWLTAANAATGRFTVVATANVAALLAGGIVNTWFLAGTVPALVGTTYGWLLLAKIGLFFAMLVVAAVNLFRLAPRLSARLERHSPGRSRSPHRSSWPGLTGFTRRSAGVPEIAGSSPAMTRKNVRAWPASGLGRRPGESGGDGDAPSQLDPLRTIGQLRRNVLIETALGCGVLAIVALLGTLPPGLHSEPGWPFPYRIEPAVLSAGATALLAALAVAGAAAAIATVVAAARGRYRRALGCGVAIFACVALACLPLRPALAPAYPTSFYAPAEPYDAASVSRGAGLYAKNCAMCHGASGHGDGPAAAGLSRRPANLTDAHLLAHAPGDLFWWVSRGKGNGAMPGFAAALPPVRRWDVINFIRARAAGTMAQHVTPAVGAQSGPPVPDFAFTAGDAQQTLRQILADGPVLLVLFTPPAPAAQLQAAADALHVVAVDLAGTPPPFAAHVSPDVAATLSLFRAAADGGASELLLDRNGAVRARWTAAEGLPNASTLAAQAMAAAAVPATGSSHAGHGE